MTMADATRYTDLCRICGEKTTDMLAVNIFENEGTVRQLDKKIEECLPVQVHEADQLPKMICEQCVYKLDLFFDFRERALRTENLLIHLYKQFTPAQAEQLKMEELMLVQQHHLLNEVSELELNQLEHRDTMIVEQQIIDMNGHTLSGIELSHPELIKSLNSHPIVQGNMLVSSANVMQNHRYAEDLLHQDHQMAYTTQTYSLNDITLSSEAIQDKHLNQDIQNVLVVETNLQKSVDRNQRTDKREFEIDVSESQILSESYKQQEYVKQEDSNSECRLLIDEPQPTLFVGVDCDNGQDENDVDDDFSQPELEMCNICKTSVVKDEFNAHYKQHFVKCIVCSAVLPNKEALDAHSKDVHGDTVEKIKQNIKNRLKRTTRKSNDTDSENEEETEEKSKETNEEDDMDKVLQQQIRGFPKVCNYCGKSYKSNYKLSEHMRKHTGEKPFKCGSCDKAFRSKIGLAQHEAKHTGMYDYACSTCGKGFQCKSYLMVHQRVHSNVKPYPCTTCGQNFKSKQSLMDHTNRHLGVKPYICDICGRGFITKGLLRAHQKIHTGEDNRKYSCAVCSKMFVSKSYLQTHMKIHTGEKPFPCEVCGKGFLTRVDLRIHSTMHTGEKSYMCEICGKAFARRDALRCHRRSHTGERPYTCDLCGQTFTQFSPMVIHKRLHTGERPYTCEVCNKTFITRSTMMTHLKKHNVKQENG